MKRLLLGVILIAVIALGAGALYASGGEPGPPCDPDPTIQCLDYVRPVVCVKPGEGWKWYSNACRAWKDCALMWTCRETGT